MTNDEGLIGRYKAVLCFKEGAFRSIARAPSTLQGFAVALLGIALAGSLASVVAMVTLVYPAAGLACVVMHV